VIRVVLPYHLRTLAQLDGEATLDIDGMPTIGAVLEALEAQYPVLRGTIRDHGTLRRRPFIRFYACKDDLSNEDPGTVLPQPIVQGEEPLFIVGAMAGG
jgi:hypothetical protein